MKKFTVAVVAILAVCSTVAYVSADSQGEKGFVVGTVIEASTYAIKGLSDPGYAAAAASRTSQGFPVGIVEDETGEVYICIFRNNAPASGAQTANEILKPMMGKKAVVQGMIYKAKGLNVIRISNVSEY
ncbi:MAG: hypothetical protein COA73_14255 [Candidatus Hydrogenedentota bacterium]|nr:MAG: hypothetical protein COA73_14255 [Candidatus Hydrogenedentota bacterium]